MSRSLPVILARPCSALLIFLTGTTLLLAADWPQFRGPTGLGYSSGRGGPGFAVDPTGSGDVSQTHVRWTLSQVPEGIGSPIVVGPYVFRLHNPGILKCWEVATGKQVYAERLEGLSTTWASPIADAHGRIFFANAGRSYVIQGGSEFRVLSVNDLGEGNHPSPAVANGRMFLAGTTNLYCIAKK